jgi:hypothetical protein
VALLHPGEWASLGFYKRMDGFVHSSKVLHEICRTLECLPVLSLLSLFSFCFPLKFVVPEFEELCKNEQVKECFLNYLRHDKAEVNVLFEMLSIFLVRTRIDYTFLKEFYMVEVKLLLHSGLWEPN